MAASSTTLNLSSDQDGTLYHNGHQQADIEAMRKALNGQHYKRERSQNWEQEEKFVLVRLVQKRLAIIEEKASDTDAVRRRKQAWRDIHTEFTAKIGSRTGTKANRSVQRIREQWRRMKYWARHEMDVYQESRVEVNGEVRYGRKPNELAQYINGMMAAVERINYARMSRPSQTTDHDLQLQGDIQDVDLQSQSQLSLPDPTLRPDPHPEQSVTTLKANKGGTPDVMETPQVKQESVDLVDEDESSVTMVTVSSIQPSDVHSPPCQVIPQQVIRVDPNGHASVSNPILPSWARDFPEIVGDSAASRPPLQVDNDEDDSEFLDDSEDDDMLGSYTDWERDIPVTARAYDGQDTASTRLPSMESNTNCKLENQRQLHARWEFKRRMQMMEEEHARRMQILEIQRETAQMKKKLMFRQLKKRRAPSSSISNPYGRRVHLQR